jgi:acetyltransferase
LAALCNFADWVNAPTAEVKQFDVDQQTVQGILERERAAGRTQIVELPALEVLNAYGFSVVPYRLAKTGDDATAAANEMGYPVVMKIAAPEVLHKTDIGGVKLDIQNDDQARAAFDEIITNVKSKMGDKLEIWGVLVQKMLPPGKEVILGVSRDPKFGPLIMFGLGGIYAEALRDVSFRLAPLRDRVADEMIRSIRSYKLLEGIRGEPPSDIPAAAESLLRLSQLVADWPEIKELDINPMIVYPRGKGVMAADARIILDSNSSA